MKTPIMANRSLRSLTNAHGSLPYTPVRPSSSSTWSSFKPVGSSPSTGSTAFWRTPPKKGWRIYTWQINNVSIPHMIDIHKYLVTHKVIIQEYWKKLLNRKLPCRYFPLVVCAFLAFLFWLQIKTYRPSVIPDIYNISAFQHIQPAVPLSNVNQTNPIKWLAENSNNKYAVSASRISQLSNIGRRGKPRAAIISLVRNSELEGMMRSMRQLEYRWNRKYQYPWVFFNDEPFTEEFKAGTRNMTSAKCYYELVPKEHWSLPSWIDESRFENSLEYLGTIGVGKGWMVSYHHMCRWNSGFFYKHPSLKDYDWYWRVEPDVHYFCDIDYDVFRFMQDNNIKYGFNMNILDDARSFPSLWSKTKDFAAAYPNLIHPEADPSWLIDTETGGEYNNCQFFSNFEIGSLNFWRGKANEAYFNWLDRAGGFYYERFGDAPVHTLSVAMFLPKSEIWFFRDIGYQHDINHHCPPHREGKCSCQPTTIDENFYKLVPLESPQAKPADTCIRQFLGGDWLKKREGWTMAGEKAYGGDGYHGYEIW